MMKKLIALILALMLPLCASAATVTGTHTTADVVYMGAVSNTYIVQSDAGYQIFAADGTAIGPVWPQMGPKLNGAYYQVLNGSSINVVSAKGDVVLLDNYFGFVTAGDAWLLGIVMEETTDANADYTSKAGKKMNVVRADVVVDGKMIGSLSREQYQTSASAGQMGDYLFIYHVDGRTLFFDKALNQTAEVVLAAKPDEEFTLEGDKYVHVPTQQVAFCAESTLTEAQVSQPVMVIGTDVVGLQGQVLFTLPADGHISATVHGGYVDQYAFVNGDLGHGLWDYEGKQIIPPRYDLATNQYSDNACFQSGYEACLTMGGDLYFYDTTGAVTASVTDMGLKYTALTGFGHGMPILAIKSGADYFLVTATQGLLPGVYDDFDLGPARAKLAAVSQNGQWGCIDLNGATVVPFEYEGIAISSDGTLVMGQKPDGTWVVYNIAY